MILNKRRRDRTRGLIFKTKSRKRQGKIVCRRQEGRNQETDDRPKRPSTVRWPTTGAIIIFGNEHRD